MCDGSSVFSRGCSSLHDALLLQLLYAPTRMQVFYMCFLKLLQMLSFDVMQLIRLTGCADMHC